MRTILIFKKGFVNLAVLVGMLLVAISLPIATSLVQQNQENRSNAATSACTLNAKKCSGNFLYTCKKNSSGSTYWDGTYCKNGCASNACKSSSSSSTSSSTCTNGTKKCSGGTVYTCTSNKWVSSYQCANGCDGTGCKTVTCTYTCDKWSDCKADSSSLTGGTQSCTAESKSSTSCTGGSSKIGTTQNCTVSSSSSFSTSTTTTCSATDCANCSQAECSNTSGCNWGYNGSSSMYCYSDAAKGPTLTPTPSDCNAATAGNTKCINGNVQKCFYDANDSTSGWGIYRDCGGSGCTDGVCNNVECANSDATICTNGILKYCSNGKWITSTCMYGCNSGGSECKTNTVNTSCIGTGLSCKSKCSKSEHAVYAYTTSSVIKTINGCNNLVCCAIDDIGCTEGDTECRKKDGWNYYYGLFTCSSGTMKDTGKKCLISGDNIYYEADVPEGWVSNRNRATNPMTAGIDLTQYQIELLKKIDETGGPGTRAAVAAAALYLAEEFPYTIPYQSGGGDAENAITSQGFQLTINESDGTFTYTANWNNKTGLNCLGLVEWAYRAAGFNTGLKNNSTQEVTTYSGNKQNLTSEDSSSKDQAKLDTVEIGDLMYNNDSDITHVALITDIDYASGTVQIVQSSSGAGVNVEYIDLFTLQEKDGTGSKNNFRAYTHIGDSYFEQEPDLLK